VQRLTAAGFKVCFYFNENFYPEHAALSQLHLNACLHFRLCFPAIHCSFDCLPHVAPAGVPPQASRPTCVDVMPSFQVGRVEQTETAAEAKKKRGNKV